MMLLDNIRVALVGFTLLHAIPCLAQSLPPPCPAASRPISGASPPGGPADSPRAQSNARPHGDETRDRDAYGNDVRGFYAEHLTAYAAQLRRFATDAGLLEEFKSRLQEAKRQVARSAADYIASGYAPIDPSTGAGTLTNADPLSPTDSTPVEIGNRDLASLADNVAIDRAALRESCETLGQDRQILDRIDGHP